MNIRISFFTVCLSMAVLAAGCSSDKVDPVVNGNEEDNAILDSIDAPSSGGSDTEGNSSVFGVWVSECEVDESIDYYEWTFGPDQVIVDSFEYAEGDSQCSTPVQRQTATFSVTYLTETVQTSLGAATKYDLTPVAFTNYENIDSAVDGIPVDIADIYGIYLVVNNRLYGGDLSSGAGSSPDNRPTRIDEADYLTKK